MDEDNSFGKRGRSNRRDSGRPRRRDSGGFGRRDSGGDSGGFGRRDFGRSNIGSERPTMHEVTCDKCGERCEVPFKPTAGKPVYCKDCFRKNEGPASRPESRNRPNQFEKEFEQINRKLDKILEAIEHD
jgi:CxxC-x17-CxxC domain-containing protein